jgi:hypothetical protein
MIIDDNQINDLNITIKIRTIDSIEYNIELSKESKIEELKRKIEDVF